MKFKLPIFILLLLSQINAFGQGFYTDFGKNRVQSKDYEWLFYQENKFDVYYYGGGRDMARYVLLEAEKHIDEIESFFDYRLDEKIVFILYNSKADFNESNQFISRDQFNIGGTTRIMGTTAFLYFDETHQDFIENVRQGIASVVLNEMLFGGSVQERVQNSTLLNLPEWYIKGIISFVSKQWNSEMDNRLRNGVLSGKFRKMASQTSEDKELICHAMWDYINKTYEDDAVSNIVYVARINKSMESGFQFVLSKGLNELYDEWLAYEYERFLKQEELLNDAENEIRIPRRVTRKTTIPRFEISADGRFYALVSNNMGLIKVWIYDQETKSLKKIHKTGYKSAEKEMDLSYPLVKWDLLTRDLWIIDQKNGNPFLYVYNVDRKKFIKKDPILRVEKIYSLDLSPDGRYAVLAGLNSGQSDIFLYDRISGFVRPITNDDANDLDPVFSQNGNLILFSSNRTNTQLKRNTRDVFSFSPSLDLYAYDYKNKAKEVVRLTYTATVNERMPKPFNDEYITYLGNTNFHYDLNALKRIKKKTGIQAIFIKKNGLISPNDTLMFESASELDFYRNELKADYIENLSRIDTQTIWHDTAYCFKLTNFPFSIGDYSLNPDRTKYKYLAYDHLIYRIYEEELPENLELQPLTLEGEFKNTSSNYVITPQIIESDSNTQPKFKYYFESGFEDQENYSAQAKLKHNLVDNSIENNDKVFDYKRTAKAYYLSFTPDEIITQFDNGFLQTPYLPYKEGENYIYPPALRSFFKLGVSDMFKDYRLIGGARLDVNLQGIEYFVQYDNFKKRLDKSFMYYRSTRKENDGDVNKIRTSTQEFRGILKWPFNEMASLRMNAFVRIDEEFTLATSRQAIENAATNHTWVGGKLEYVFDNTIQDGMNLMYGLRYKVYAETYYDFFDNENMFIFGGDFRHYQKLFRTLTWCNRFAMGSSGLGNGKVVYFLGGTEKWMSPRFEQDIAVDEEVNFLYKSLAANLRGYPQNTRNGASYMVLNSELRWPLFRFFSNKPLKSKFMENFQVIGFVDAGTAFNGYSPFDENNAFDKRIINSKPLRIEVSTLRDPIIAGYGYGVRSTVLGYYIRLDRAWNSEVGIEPEKLWYVSLGFDF
ncbi:MAG: PD40 domain-containing protein [Bacteroidetes bacterium]|nr:PD40 domain-containing protein [Bacteroidota bacterium]